MGRDIVNENINLFKRTIMKRLLLLAAVLMCAGFTFAQTMMEIPVERRFHAMSENGKYMLTVEQGYIGIYNTETGEYQDYSNYAISYDLGMGNMVTDDGFLVGNVNGIPSILDIEKKEWTQLGLKEEANKSYSTANAITPSHKYIIGYVSTGNGFGRIMGKPVIWTLKDDGSYGVYEDLPYPDRDFSGVQPKYILPNCISEDGSVIAAQLMREDNMCLPMVYRRAQDGTWTYEVYDKGLCEPGLDFPEFPEEEPALPDPYDYLTDEAKTIYSQDSTAYEDSCWAYNIGESTVWPSYYPDIKNYMTDEARGLYDENFDKYVEESNVYSEQLRTFRDFYHENVTPDFYGQNAVWMPSGGKYYVTTCIKSWMETVSDAAVFTIGDELEKHDYEDGLYGYCATNDGDIFVSDLNTAYVYPAGSTERVTLVEWLRMKGEDEAADWLSNVTTGTAICSGDGRVISGFSGAPGSFKSWIIKLDDVPTGITEVNGDKADGGNVKVYDLQGRLVKEGPESEVRNGLRKGVYIINNRKVAIR